MQTWGQFQQSHVINDNKWVSIEHGQMAQWEPHQELHIQNANELTSNRPVQSPLPKPSPTAEICCCSSLLIFDDQLANLPTVTFRSAILSKDCDCVRTLESEINRDTHFRLALRGGGLTFKFVSTHTATPPCSSDSRCVWFPLFFLKFSGCTYSML